jgi:outer membrane protein TolC
MGGPTNVPLTVPGTEFLPLTDEIDTFTTDLAIPFRFRNGIVASPFLSTLAAQDVTKSGIPTRFQADAGLRIDWPLGKGGGTASAGAAERAARLGSEAALHLVAQAASESILNTVLAYWTLAAAQERLVLLERSADQQRQIERVSQTLVQADEIPRSELDRIRARVADAETSAAQARQLLVAARVDLAIAMGSVVADLNDAPLAADALPPSPGLAELEKAPAGLLAAIASRRRADLAAARKQRDAADVLWTAARIDLRPRFDLSVQASYSALGEDATKGAANLDGTWNAITGRWAGPNAALSLRFELPFGNNASRGQWVQAGAAREQADIAALNLARTAASRTAELSVSVQRSAAEVSARDVSAQENDRAVSAAFEQLRAGELSLVDAIVTERNQTQAGLDLVASRRTLASLVAQLRFETGSLVPYVVNGADVAFGEASPVGLSFAE